MRVAGGKGMMNESAERDTHVEMSASAITIAWLVLSAFALAGWFLAQRPLSGWVMVTVTVLAGIKMYVLLAFFMGLWRSPRRWHALALVWVCGTLAAVALLAHRAFA